MRSAPALIVCSWASLALAHGIDHPRRISLELKAPDAILGTFEFALAPDQAANVRRLFDRDRNGRIGPAERPSLERYLALRARGTFALTCGGKRAGERPGAIELLDVDSPKGMAARVRVDFTTSSLDCRIEDDGGAEGHVPVMVTGARVDTDAPRTSPQSWDLPARRIATLVLEPR